MFSDSSYFINYMDGVMSELKMSAKDRILKCIVAELCEAVRLDEDSCGIDISGGLYGDATSQFMRDTAWNIAKLSEQVDEARSSRQELIDKLTADNKRLREFLAEASQLRDGDMGEAADWLLDNTDDILEALAQTEEA